MYLDYSTFSISNALGTRMVSVQHPSATTVVAPQERSFAEQETCQPRDQADGTQNQHDVDITSCHNSSLNPTPQRRHFISPQHSFSHTSEDYDRIPSRSDFVHNTSSVQQDCFQDVYPFVAWVASYQHQQHNLIYPSADIALALGGQSPYVLSLNAPQNSQGYPSAAVNSITHHTSPLIPLDNIYGTCPALNCEYPVFYSPPPTDHVPSVPFPVTDFDRFHSLTVQENAGGVFPLFQSDSQSGQQLDVTHGTSAGSSRPLHDIKASTPLPPRFHSADPPRTRVLGKRLRRISSDSHVAERDTTAKKFRVESNSSIKRTVPVPHTARSFAYLDAQHARVAPQMEISRTAPRRVECDGRIVDECAVQKAIENEQPSLCVYECKWNKNHSPCHMYIEGDQLSITDHLSKFHNFTGGEGDTACLWDGCTSKKCAAMKGTSIARHLVTHISYKVKCTTCNVIFSREDACRRSHGNVRSDCRNMQMDPVHDTGVIALRIQNCGPAAKKRRPADS